MKDPGRKRTIGAWIARIIAIVLIIAGLVVVGFFVLFVTAMASFGSNK